MQLQHAGFDSLLRAAETLSAQQDDIQVNPYASGLAPSCVPSSNKAMPSFAPLRPSGTQQATDISSGVVSQKQTSPLNDAVKRNEHGSGAEQHPQLQGERRAVSLDSQPGFDKRNAAAKTLCTQLPAMSEMQRLSHIHAMLQQMHTQLAAEQQQASRRLQQLVNDEVAVRFLPHTFCRIAIVSQASHHADTEQLLMGLLQFHSQSPGLCFVSGAMA